MGFQILTPISERKTRTDVCRMEGLLPIHHSTSAVEIPGARAVLNGVIATGIPWTIVTSGTLPLVTGWLRVLGLPQPPHLVTAESVESGKPDPACYLLGREKLGLQLTEQEVLVVEDSPAGIKAGKAAGCKVIGLVTSHAVEQVLEADWVVKDLNSVKVVPGKQGKVSLEIRDALVR